MISILSPSPLSHNHRTSLFTHNSKENPGLPFPCSNPLDSIHLLQQGTEPRVLIPLS